ncbi:MAG: hypothetical protein RBT74_00280 [Tenuifilaceae bacterium]|jgi:hypothetical protein|nr:hypothetical protein [Tenuifilaceae bacterium]
MKRYNKRILRVESLLPITLFSIVVLTSCVKSTPSLRPIEFRPKECKNIYVAQAKRIPVYGQNREIVRYDYRGTDEITIPIEDFGLAIFTYNQTLSVYNDVLDVHITQLEMEIEQSYRRSSKTASSTGVKNSFEYDAPPIIIEYRTTGISSISISSQQVSMFGEEVGQPLNQHVAIVQYDPDFIASSESKSLLYGYSETGKPTTLAEWIGLSPLAQPLVYLRLKTAPTTLPINTSFRVDVITAEGIELSYTTRQITITP